MRTWRPPAARICDASYSIGPAARRVALLSLVKSNVASQEAMTRRGLRLARTIRGPPRSCRSSQPRRHARSAPSRTAGRVCLDGALWMRLEWPPTIAQVEVIYPTANLMPCQSDESGNYEKASLETRKASFASVLSGIVAVGKGTAKLGRTTLLAPEE
jgi:hypothetical protein